MPSGDSATDRSSSLILCVNDCVSPACAESGPLSIWLSSGGRMEVLPDHLVVAAGVSGQSVPSPPPAAGES